MMKRKATRELSIEAAMVSNTQYKKKKLNPSFTVKVKWEINLIEIKFNCIIFLKINMKPNWFSRICS